MITPTTRRDVIAHQLVVPWQSQVQVEQDLLLCRAMVALLWTRHVADRGFCSDMNPLLRVGINYDPGTM